MCLGGESETGNNDILLRLSILSGRQSCAPGSSSSCLALSSLRWHSFQEDSVVPMPSPDRLVRLSHWFIRLTQLWLPSSVYGLDFFLEGSSGLMDFWEATSRLPSCSDVLRLPREQ